ncbi:MAG TPA: Hpt domain-containing protein [Polyangiaceae bacterium]|nr:Hpt domain-containing protein [Polyangiaceae bacterium]
MGEPADPKGVRTLERSESSDDTPKGVRTLERSESSDDTPPEIARLLAAAREDFAARLVGRAGELSSLAERLSWNELRLAAHKLRGSCATYGFVAAGGLAGRVEDILLRAGGEPKEGDRAAIAAAIDAFAAEAKVAGTGRA